MNKSFIPFAALALTLAGCSNEEGGGRDSYVAEGTPITVNTMVGELATKAGYDPSTSPTEFYLRIKNESNSKYSYYAQMKNDNGTWKSFDTTDGTTALPMYWAGDGNDVNVTAATFDFWDTTTGEPATSAELTIASDQSDDAKLKTCDHLMQLTTATEPATSGITVSLTHIMAKLHIVVDLGKDNTSTADPLSKVQVSGTNLTGSYNFADAKTAAWVDNTTATKNVAEITVCPVAFTAANATTSTNAKAEYEAIIVPQTIAQGEFGFSFEMNNKAYTWKSESEVTLDPNTQYTLTMKMNGGALALSSVSTAEWGTNKELDGGTMSEDTGKGTLTVTSTTGGEVTEKAIAAAIDGNKLKIVGALNSDDIAVLAKNTTIKELDLSKANVLDLDKLYFYYTEGTSSDHIGNKTLTKVVLPEGITYVPTFCFHFCTSLTSVTIPNTVTKINDLAFSGCSSLASIELPDGLTTISGYALSGTALNNPSLPNSLTSLGSGVFQSCESLTEITIPAGVSTTAWDHQMFSNCTNLKKVTYLSSAPTIQQYDFANTKVGEIYLPNCTALPSASAKAFKSNDTSIPDLTSVKVYVQPELYKNIVLGSDPQSESAPWTDSCVSWEEIESGN